jgi:hypothetical protein
MSHAMLVGTVLALLFVGVPLWCGFTPGWLVHRGAQVGVAGPHAQLRRARALRRVGGDLCTLSGPLSAVSALGARGVLGETATLAVFLVLLQAGLGLGLLRALRALRAPAARWSSVHRGQG